VRHFAKMWKIKIKKEYSVTIISFFAGKKSYQFWRKKRFGKTFNTFGFGFGFYFWHFLK
jgi:hypothetical protein